MNTSKKLYLLITITILGFISLILLNNYLDKFVAAYEKSTKNQQAKVQIGNLIADDVKIINAKYYELITVSNTQRIKQNILTATDNIKEALDVLQNGGTISRIIKLNIAGHLSEIDTIDYKNTAGEITLESIDVLPKLIRLARMVKKVEKLLKLRDEYKNKKDDKNYIKTVKKINRYYKTAPAFFIRLAENIRALRFEGNIKLKELQKDMLMQKQKYSNLKILLFICVTIMVLVLGLWIIRIVNQDNRKLFLVKNDLAKLNDNLEKKVFLGIQKSKDIERKLFESEKLASMGEMIGNIAHQWRQPLSVISTASTGMKIQKECGVLSDEQFYNNCNTINDNAQYLSKTIDDFRSFIKGERIKCIFKIKEGIDSFLNLVESSIKTYHIKVILDIKDDIKIDGYQNELIQCFINIFNNSKNVMEEENKNNRLFFILADQQDDNIVIKFKDSGGGIPDEIVSKIFEPYFTTKHKSQGTGLGLNMTHQLITEGMNGTISASTVTYLYEEKDYIGAEFEITLPLS